jgi:copper chaperone CopZ
MKNLLQFVKRTILALSIVIISTVAYAGDKKDKKVETVVFEVEMFCCHSCVTKIEKNIPFEKGVKDLKVDFDSKKVTIKFRADKTNKENLKKAMNKLEFKVKEVKS